MKHALEEWLQEASGDVASGQSPMVAPDNMAAPDMAAPDMVAPNMAALDLAAPETTASKVATDVTQDPDAPDMPTEINEQDFEQWKSTFFKESVKGDANKLIELIQQVRDLPLDSYPRKFVEDNLQVCFLRQHANIDKASKEIRKRIKNDLDRNNPSVSLVNHMDSTLQTMPELNSVFIKLKGLLGMKGDLHRKFISSLFGGIQVGTGGNNEDVIYNERDYSIRLSTRYNDKWGKLDIGKWCLKEDDADR